MKSRIKCASRLSQFDCAGAPGKQGQAELLLEATDLMAERGRSDVQFVGGPGKAHMARNGLKNAQRIQRQQRLSV